MSAEPVSTPAEVSTVKSCRSPVLEPLTHGAGRQQKALPTRLAIRAVFPGGITAALALVFQSAAGVPVPDVMLLAMRMLCTVTVSHDPLRIVNATR